MDSRLKFIPGLRIKNFTCFSEIDIDFSPGINLFIGENGTGKTHLLKILFALKDLEYAYSFPENETLDVKNMVMEDIYSFQFVDKAREKAILALFQVDESNKLTRSEGGSYHISIKHEGNQLHLNKTEVEGSTGVFLPVQEMLSWYRGFIPAYENRESSIDTTYYTLAKALAPLPLKGEKLQEQMQLIADLEASIDAKVIRKDDSFFIQFNASEQMLNANLVANGINKIAQLIYLVMNGSLTKDSVLFWDEPEAGLHPRYISTVAKFLQVLAKAGCQIFVTTHDYLLSYTLSLAAEYKELEENPAQMRFFSLYKGEAGTEIESGDTLSDLQHNFILDEFSKYYQQEENLFYQSMKVPK